MKLIDSRTGAVHAGPHLIEPGWSRAQAFAAPIGPALRQFDRIGDFFTLPHLIVDEHLLVVMLRFGGNHMIWIRLSFSTPGQSWDDWSLDGEAERKRYQEQLVRADLGPPHLINPNRGAGQAAGDLAAIVEWRFPWGTVESKFEAIDSDTVLYVLPRSLT